MKKQEFIKEKERFINKLIEFKKELTMENKIISERVNGSE